MRWRWLWPSVPSVATSDATEYLRAELARERAVNRTVNERNRVLETNALDDADALGRANDRADEQVAAAKMWQEATAREVEKLKVERDRAVGRMAALREWITLNLPELIRPQPPGAC